MVSLDYLLLSLKTDKNAPIGPSCISGLLSSEYNRRFSVESPDTSEEHSTRPSGHDYFYPRLQYKIVRGSPLIAAINEGCRLLWDIYDKLDEANDQQSDWKITEKRLIERKAPFGLCDGFVKYRILTPWLALPEDGFKTFLVQENGNREKMLARALEGHLRAISKSLGYSIDGDIRIKVIPKSEYIFQRDIHFAGFFGSFVANFEIPNFLGLGKSVSRGYGAIKRVESSSERFE